MQRVGRAGDVDAGRVLGARLETDRFRKGRLVNQKFDRIAIAELAAMGLGSREIADRIGASPVTVRHIRRKLGMSAPKFVHEFDHDEAVRLYSEGVTAAVIAERLGVSERAVRVQVAKHGLTQPVKEFTDSEYRRADELLREGYSFTAVAGMLARAHSTIAKHFPGRGMSVADAAQAGVLARKANRVYRKLG